MKQVDYAGSFGLAQLFRLLRNALCADSTDPLGPAPTASRYVAAMENTTPSPSGSASTGGAPATGQQHGRQRTRPLVSGPGQSPLCGAFQCSLQIARTSNVDRWMLAQPTRTAVYGPVRTVVWQGSAGDRRPFADQVGLWETISMTTKPPKVGD